MSKRKSTVQPNEAVAEKTKSVPKSLKDKILDVLAIEESLVSLPKLKKILCERYDCVCSDVKQATALNSKINKTMKSLLGENRADFKKVGGSYHGANFIQNENNPEVRYSSRISLLEFVIPC